MRMTFLVSKRVLKFIFRDRRLLILMLVVPIIMSLVIGYGFSGDIKHVKVTIVNLDESTIEVPGPIGNVTISLSELMIDWLIDETDKVDVELIENATITSWNETKQAVLDKQAKGGILFPENFTIDAFSSLNPGSGASTFIETFIDNSNPQEGANIIQALREALEAIFGSHMGLKINNNYAYGATLTQLQYMAPSILPFAVFFLSFIISIISLINERKSGTMDLLLLSPYHKINIILGYILSLSVISIIQSTILLIFTIFVFDISIAGGAGSYFAVYFMLLLISWSGMGLGFLLSTVAKTELQAIQFVPMIIFPSLLLSGILWPLDALPIWIRPISYVIPLTYGADYLRTVMIEGTGFLWHWNIAAVIAFVLLMIIFSSLTLREK